MRISLSLSMVSGGHHGRFPDASTVSGLACAPSISGWSDAQFDLLNAWLEDSDAEAVLDKLRNIGIKPRSQVLLTGIVILADWASSNAGIFDLETDGMPRDRSSRLRRAFKSLGLPEAWAFGKAPDTVMDYFEKRFELPSGAVPNAVQNALYELVQHRDTASLYVVEAPTGSGKTEMALAAAEAIAGKMGLDGMVFALPTMATTDAIMNRCLGWLQKTIADGTGTPTFSLGHSKSQYNESYAALPIQRMNAPLIHDDDDGNGGHDAIVHHFYSDRKRVLQPNIAVVTIDQILMAALNTKHYCLRHLGLASKIVIIDEVHAADSHMAEFLKRSLEWLALYEVPVILMTATLPWAQKHALIEAYYGPIRMRQEKAGLEGVADVEVVVKALPQDGGYPRITVAGEDGIQSIDIPLESDPKGYRLVKVEDDLERLWEAMEPRLASGGIVGIVCNTIRRAQDAYAFFNDKTGGAASLLHSRFLTADRLRLEEDLLSFLGPPRNGVNRPSLRVVVGTSVLEQSLDIDFDLLVTDIAPMDLLIQRVGRLHRHRRDRRPAAMGTPEVWVRGLSSWNDSNPTLERSAAAIYQEYALFSTLAILERESAWEKGVQLPHQAATLVQQAYGDDVVFPAEWTHNKDELAQKAHLADAKKRQRALTGLIPRPGTKLNLLLDSAGIKPMLGQVTTGLAAAAREEAAAVSSVRDIEDSFEVILMRRTPDGISGFEWQEKLANVNLTDQARIDDPTMARDIMRNSIRLPLEFSRSFEDFDRTLTELEQQGVASWQEEKLLKGQLVLFLDEHSRGTLAGRDLSYDKHLGLIVVNPTKEHTL
ncbi:CRISPR-associated helicase/endonuclease Cas3 [Paeniglutamicibacter cryotolerans]